MQINTNHSIGDVVWWIVGPACYWGQVTEVNVFLGPGTCVAVEYMVRVAAVLSPGAFVYLDERRLFKDLKTAKEYASADMQAELLDF